MESSWRSLPREGASAARGALSPASPPPPCLPSAVPPPHPSPVSKTENTGNTHVHCTASLSEPLDPSRCPRAVPRVGVCVRGREGAHGGDPETCRKGRGSGSFPGSRRDAAPVTLRGDSLPIRESRRRRPFYSSFADGRLSQQRPASKGPAARLRVNPSAGNRGHTRARARTARPPCPPERPPQPAVRPKLGVGRDSGGGAERA